MSFLPLHALVAVSVTVSLLSATFAEIVEEGGAIAENNLAPTGTAFAKDLINNGGFAVHQIPHINDETYGNSNSWIGDSEGSFVGIAFESAIEIQSLAFGRDNGGEDTEFTDRSVGVYVVQFTDANNPANAPDALWDTLDTLDYTQIGGLLTKPHLRHRYNFEQTEATGIRIITFNGACIDEIEIYGQPGEIQAPPPTMTPAFEGGEFAADNLAEGATPFTNGDLGPDLGIDFHVAANLNDQIYGNSNSWIGNSPAPFGGISLGSVAVTVQSFAFGRDNTGGFADRNLGAYTVQTTTVENPDASTPDESWTTIGLIIYSAGAPANPALRHGFNLGAPIEITGLRLLTPAGAAIDELEIYAGTLSPPPPPVDPGVIIESAAGFDITHDGNDGDLFDPVPPPDGAIVPDNLALAGNGATPIGSTELGPELGIDFHLISNVNDGLYGNSNSWISASGDGFPFIGVALGGSAEIDRIAWGRDNGNGEVDDSDPGTDACGGQCDDRSVGLYELQITTVANPDENTPDGDWTTVGTFDYLRSDDGLVGQKFTSYLRHEYAITRADGNPITATGVRILVPAAGLGGGTAIDEIEVYGASRDPFLAFDDGNEVALTFDNLDVQLIGFDLENRGARQELAISNITFEGASAADFMVVDAPETVAAGGAGGIIASFDPNGVPGTFVAEMVVMSNDSLEPEQRVSITVQVNAVVDPDRDTDGDGVPDAAEMIAGTDPNDAGSFFAAKSLTQTDGGIVLSWSSVDGRTYSIEYSDTLQPGGWLPVAGAETIAPTVGGTTSFTIPAVGGIDERWFRVLVR